ALRLFLAGPCQAKQLSEKMGRISRLNPTGLVFGSTANAVMHPQRTSKPVQFHGLAENRRIICFPFMEFCGPPRADRWERYQTGRYALRVLCKPMDFKMALI